MSGLDVECQFRVRAIGEVFAGTQGDDQQAVINPRGDIAWANALPFRTEETRMRRSFKVITVTAVAPVVAIPTVTSQLSLWNGEQDNGKIYVITKIGAYCVVSAGAATGIQMVHLINVSKVAAPTSAGLTMRGTAGQVYNGSAINALAVTVVDDGWFPAGNSVVGAASQIGLAVEADIAGGIIVPPGYRYSTAVVANTVTTITVRQYIEWMEVILPLGT
jgi:hypothetical protein